jgi:HlyD family secretion protein
MRLAFRRPRISRRVAAGLLLAAMALAVIGARQMRRGRDPGIPTQIVTRGAYLDQLQLRAEFKPIKSTVTAAPSGAGDLLILQLAKNGTMVRKGDFIVQFDGATVQRTLDQKRSDLKQAEAEVARTQAQARMREEAIATELQKAKYDLERARLDASAEGLISRVELEKFRLAVADAEQKVRELEQKGRSDRVVGNADAASGRHKADKARFEVEQAERQLAALRVTAPADGLLTLLPNYRASTPFNAAPEFKAGDRAWSGAPIAELPDLTTIQVVARVDEADRSRLKQGLQAAVSADALPELDLKGTVTAISALAKPDFSSWPPTRNFDVTVALERGEKRLRGGMSATLRIALERLEDSIIVPSRALFERSGRTVVFVSSGGDFEERAVEIVRRGREQAAVRGVDAGDRVALQDPTVEAAR